MEIGDQDLLSISSQDRPPPRPLTNQEPPSNLQTNQEPAFNLRTNQEPAFRLWTNQEPPSDLRTNQEPTPSDDVLPGSPAAEGTNRKRRALFSRVFSKTYLPENSILHKR